jgi:hypothetical protein
MTPKEIFDELYGENSIYNPYSENYKWESNGNNNLNSSPTRDIVITDSQSENNYVITPSKDNNNTYNITQIPNYYSTFNYQGTTIDYEKVIVTPTLSGSWNVSLVAAGNWSYEIDQGEPNLPLSCEIAENPDMIEDSGWTAFTATGGTCLLITGVFPTVGEELACFPIACIGGLVGVAASSVTWLYSVFDCGSKRK